MTEKASEPQKRPTYLKDLILLFAVPAGIAILAALMVYVPRLLAHPKYDFIYSVCDYSCNSRYTVNPGGQLKVNYYYGTQDILSYGDTETLRYYSAGTDSSRTIGFDEAQRYNLNTSNRSPDGYTLQQEDTSGGFLLWGSYDSGWYLKHGLKQKKVTLTATNSSYGSNDITFLGWVNK